jgi:hypothetical protein
LIAGFGKRVNMDRAWFELAGSCLSRMIQMEGKKTGCFVRKHDDDEKKMIRHGILKFVAEVRIGLPPVWEMGNGNRDGYMSHAVLL